jgi:hypothetical protein
MFLLYFWCFFFVQFFYRSIESMSTEHAFANTWINPRAATDIRAYSIPLQFLEQLSQNGKAKDTWLALLTAVMGVVAKLPYYDDTEVDEFVKNEKNAHLVRGRNPLYDPLIEYEEPNPRSAGSTQALKRPFVHLLNSYKLSFWMPWPLGMWPQGLRNNLPPPKDPYVGKAITRKTRLLRQSIVAGLESEYFNIQEFLDFMDGDDEDHGDSDDELPINEKSEVPYGTFHGSSL